MAKPVVGTCHVCGAFGPLTFEHVPPKAAFNGLRVRMTPLAESIGLEAKGRGKGRLSQRGMGAYATCHRCNNDLGGWYARAFVEWCVHGMAILDRTGGRPTLVYAHRLFPLRVLKQIVAMFFAINGPEFRTAGDGRNEDLVRLLLNKEATGLPPGVRLFAFFNAEGVARTSGVSALVNFHTGRDSILTEIVFPPFGYLLTFDSDPPDPRLFEITHFAWYGYGDERTVHLELPTLPTYLPLPGDYRSAGQIAADQAHGEASMARRRHRDGGRRPAA